MYCKYFYILDADHTAILYSSYTHTYTVQDF